MNRTKVAVIGSGNIGTDLMIKVLRVSERLEMGAMVGIDPESDGLARAARFKVPTTSNGVAGLIAMPNFDEIDVVFDATSAGAHKANVSALAPYGKRLIDLTPAAIGPFLVLAVNMDAHLDAENVNMVTCGGQATIPIVAAISRLTRVPYAEIDCLDCLDCLEVGGSGYSRQHRRVHRDHQPCYRGSRRRRPRQGHLHPQPG